MTKQISPAMKWQVYVDGRVVGTAGGALMLQGVYLGQK